VSAAAMRSVVHKIGTLADKGAACVVCHLPAVWCDRYPVCPLEAPSPAIEKARRSKSKKHRTRDSAKTDAGEPEPEGRST